MSCSCELSLGDLSPEQLRAEIARLEELRRAARPRRFHDCDWTNLGVDIEECRRALLAYA